MLDVQPTIENRLEIGHENKGALEHPWEALKPELLLLHGVQILKQPERSLKIFCGSFKCSE